MTKKKIEFLEKELDGWVRVSNCDCSEEDK